jgi:hypothetical protein
VVAGLALLAACSAGDAEPGVNADDTGDVVDSTQFDAPSSLDGTAPPTATAAPTTTAPASTTTPSPPTTTAPALPVRAATPGPGPGQPVVPLGPGDRRVYVLGDSVLVGAAAQLPGALAGWDVTVDAAENRLVTQAAGILDARQAAYDGVVAQYRAEHGGEEPPPSNPFGRVVVVHLCTSFWAGGGFGTYVERIMDRLDGVERVVWVTCTPWDDGPVEANAAIEESLGRYPNVVVADWAALSGTPGYTFADGIHLAGPGRDALAALVATAVGPAPPA